MTYVHACFRIRSFAVSSEQSLPCTEFSLFLWMSWSFQWCSQCTNGRGDEIEVELSDDCTSEYFRLPLCYSLGQVYEKISGMLHTILLVPCLGLKCSSPLLCCVRVVEGYQTSLKTVDHAYRKYMCKVTCSV